MGRKHRKSNLKSKRTKQVLLGEEFEKLIKEMPEEETKQMLTRIREVNNDLAKRR